jgi:hypothetical protein
MSWQNAIILKEGEHVVHSWEGNYEKPYKTMDGDFQLITLGGHRGRKYREKEKSKPINGVLALTNRRLIWFQQRGLIGKSYHALFEIYLQTLKGISMGGLISKYVSITDEKAEYRFHLKHIGEKELESFKDMILRQEEKAPKDAIMVPCEYCAILIPENSSSCSNCGALKKKG